MFDLGGGYRGVVILSNLNCLPIFPFKWCLFVLCTWGLSVYCGSVFWFGLPTLVFHDFTVVHCFYRLGMRRWGRDDDCRVWYERRPFYKLYLRTLENKDDSCV